MFYLGCDYNYECTKFHVLEEWTYLKSFLGKKKSIKHFATSKFVTEIHLVLMRKKNLT